MDQHLEGQGDQQQSEKKPEDTPSHGRQDKWGQNRPWDRHRREEETAAVVDQSHAAICLGARYAIDRNESQRGPGHHLRLHVEEN